MIQIFTPKLWKEYSLIDCGDFEKLERFGQYTLRRPEPQAVWKKSLSEKEWQDKTDAFYKAESSHRGEWKVRTGFKEPWEMAYYLPENELRFKLSLTSFKHVGIFPEQASNWEYIYKTILGYKADVRLPKVLNLFAYTGGSSLAAKAAGADVTHVDSVKQVINWASTNQSLSKLKDIRWVVEDALKFAEREAKRGHLYNGIILDPPSYGIGANGERWKLEELIDQLLKTLSKILHPDHRFLILNCYSLGFSSLIVKNLLLSNFKNTKQLEIGEMVLKAQTGLDLPLGVVGRFQ